MGFSPPPTAKSGSVETIAYCFKVSRLSPVALTPPLRCDIVFARAEMLSLLKGKTKFKSFKFSCRQAFNINVV